MHLRRFRSATVRDALSAARNSLGPDALVLSTTLVPAAGWRGWFGAREVEVTAAAEREVSESRQERQETRHPRPSAAVDAMVARLLAVGFDSAVAAEIAAGSGGRKRADAARHAVTAWAGRLAADDKAYARVEVFVGPPGAGKTTTVAKLAAQERVARGARLGLIAADGFRVGAIEQLRLYADIIGSPFAAVRTPLELERALGDSRSTVLVDTAGRSPRDGEARELFAVLAATPSVRTHLVIPANASARDLEAFVESHLHARPDRVVITKIDEAMSVAPIAGVIRTHGLRVSYLGTGQRVPEDLVKITTPVLASALLGETSVWAGSAA